MEWLELKTAHPASMLLARLVFSRFDAVTAAQIIDQIRRLPPVERSQVIDFARGLGRRLTGRELAELAGDLLNEIEPARILELHERLVMGFYGDLRDA